MNITPIVFTTTSIGTIITPYGTLFPTNDGSAGGVIDLSVEISGSTGPGSILTAIGASAIIGHTGLQYDGTYLTTERITTNYLSSTGLNTGPITSDIILADNLMPEEYARYDLGSEEYKFRQIHSERAYAATGTIKVGAKATIKAYRRPRPKPRPKAMSLFSDFSTREIIPGEFDDAILLPSNSTIGGVLPGSVIIKGYLDNTSLLPTDALKGHGYIVGNAFYVAQINNPPNVGSWQLVPETLGTQGDIGDIGTDGYQGFLGFQGDTGFQGDQGNTGNSGFEPAIPDDITATSVNAVLGSFSDTTIDTFSPLNCSSLLYDMSQNFYKAVLNNPSYVKLDGTPGSVFNGLFNTIILYREGNIVSFKIEKVIGLPITAVLPGERYRASVNLPVGFAPNDEVWITSTFTTYDNGNTKETAWIGIVQDVGQWYFTLINSGSWGNSSPTYDNCGWNWNLVGSYYID